MARKARRPDFRPSPESDAAYERILSTAHRCAAALCRQTPTDDPSADASPQALALAMGMVWFLARIDPADLAAFTTGPGSLADIEFRPLAPPPARARGGRGGAAAQALS